MKQFCRIIVLLFFIWAKSLTTFAQSVFPQDAKFRHLTESQGLSQNSVSCILQDREGFMWFGTPNGLNKYDGYNFISFAHNPVDSTSIPKGNIRCIIEDKNGVLWLGITGGGLVSFNKIKGTFKVYKSSSVRNYSLSSDDILTVYEDRQGTLWIGTEGGGLNSFDKSTEKFTSYKQSRSGSISNDLIYSIIEDKAGQLWIGTFGGGLNRFDRTTQKFDNFQSSKDASGTLSNNRVTSLFEDRSGILWIGTMGGGLNSFDKKTGTFQVYKNDPQDVNSISSNNVVSIYEDRSGILWIGTIGGGLNAFNKDKLKFFSYKNDPLNTYSLSGNRVLSICEDLSGSLWIGTEGEGVNILDKTNSNFIKYRNVFKDNISQKESRILSIYEDAANTVWLGFDGGGLSFLDRTTEQIISYNGADVLNNQDISAICEDKSGLLWLGTSGNGLFCLNKKTGDLTNYKNDPQNPFSISHNIISCIHEDRQGNLWIGTTGGGLNNFRKSTKKFRRYKEDVLNPGTLSNNNVKCIFEDKSGTIWIGTDGGGLSVFSEETGKFTQYKNDPQNPASLANNLVLSIYEDKKGFLWLGNTGGGLDMFDKQSETFTHCNTNDELANSTIYGILPDRNQNLWLSTNNGICKFTSPNCKVGNAPESRNPYSYAIEKEDARFYRVSDGLPSNEFNAGAYCLGKDGWMYFGSVKGLVSFHPDKLEKSDFVPPLVITAFRVFDKPLELDSNISSKRNIVLSYKQNFFSLDFSCLNYSFNEKNRYAYKMIGFDKDWVEAGTRNTATYTNLEPGKYTFVVKANIDGVWSKKNAVISIVITPPFWRTAWFYAVCFVFIILLIFGYIKYRERSLIAEKRLLEEEVDKRTKQIITQNQELEAQRDALAAEKDISDKLLLNILPAETAEELKTKGSASVRNYRMATVLFTDFKGFSSISETMRPKDLIAELNRCFMAFDDITERYNVEKIKTIGDSYMCAGGIPIRNKSNPIDTVLAGFEIKRFMDNLRIEKESRGESFWDIRIGIHSGDIIAGVVGKRKFAYDIWGDTVNIASRMESSGEPGKINISGWTYELIKRYFDCTYRGKIPAKNKGEIDMYFVDRIKPELSENGEGVFPNEEFKKLLASI